MVSSYDKTFREIVELKAKAEKSKSDAYKKFADERESKIDELTILQSGNWNKICLNS